MDFTVTSSAFELGMGALGLALLLAIIERFHIQKMKREIDTLTLQYQRQAHAQNPLSQDAFTHCPYPVALVDNRGSIISCNTPFLQLTHNKMTGTLEEFDQLLSTAITSSINAKAHQIKSITLTPVGEQALHHLTLISWPLSNSEVPVGTVVTLHEQTRVVHRRTQHIHFEYELMQALTLLIAESKQAVNAGKATVSFTSLLRELELLTGHLNANHNAIRQTNQSSYTDLAISIKDILVAQRPLLRRQDLHCVTTIPKHAYIFGNKPDLELIFTSLFAAIELLAPYGSIVRLHLEEEGGYTLLHISLPKTHLTDTDIAQAFSFGKHRQVQDRLERITQLHLMIIREVIAKLNGNILIQSDKTEGTTITLVGASAPAKARTHR